MLIHYGVVGVLPSLPPTTLRYYAKVYIVVIILLFMKHYPLILTPEIDKIITHYKYEWGYKSKTEVISKIIKDYYEVKG